MNLCALATRLSTGMFNKVLLAFLACVLLKFMYPHPINMAEALVYISLALCVVGYWSFAAWLHIVEKEKESTADEKFPKVIEFLRENQDELSDKMEKMQTKMNALALRMGLQ